MGADCPGQRTDRGSQGRGQTRPFHPSFPGRGPRRSWAGPVLGAVDRRAPAQQVTGERSREPGISPWVSDDSSDPGGRCACPSAWSPAPDTQKRLYAHLHADGLPAAETPVVLFCQIYILMTGDCRGQEPILSCELINAGGCPESPPPGPRRHPTPARQKPSQ